MQPRESINKTIDQQDIAIIGMSCLFPGAKNYEIFWQNLLQGKNHIREIPPDRWNNDDYYSPHLTNENKMISKWGGFLDDIKGFDNDFFNILPDEARNIDPQSRLLLQETWHCIEDAFIQVKELQQATTSVYTAIFSLDHLQHMAKQSITELYACVGSYPCMSANRLSHFLQLTGASFSLDAACASSLTALHEAKLGLHSGCCDYAIVGAANVISHPWHNISMSKSRMLSPDGQCKTFDKKANGYVRGEGVAVLLLTTRKNALKKNHRVHAIIKGTAVNHCGGTRAITTPNFEAQKKVIRLALDDAKKTAEEIDFIEAHGTGTALGDAIEFNALAEVFSSKKGVKTPLGSVKTNIGHLEATAGLAGLIKTILMMKYNKIPPHLNLDDPNPLIDFKNSPFYVPHEITEWSSTKQPRLAGISSMGFGGVNSHVILEELTPDENLLPSDTNGELPFVFILSANTPNSLNKLTDQWSNFFLRSDLTKLNLTGVCYRLLSGINSLKYRTGALLINPMGQKVTICASEAQSHPFPSCKTVFANTACMQGMDETKPEQADCHLLTPRVNNLKKNSLPLSVLPATNKPKKPQDIALNIEAVDKEILPSLKSLYYLVFTNKQIKDVLSLHERYHSFLATYIISAFFLKMGIAPKIVAGQGIGQIVTCLLSKAISWKHALKLVEKKRSPIRGKRPVIPILDISSDSVIYPNAFDEEKCEEMRQGILNIDTLDSQLFSKVTNLVNDQITIKRFLESIDKLLAKHKINIINVISSQNLKATKKEAAIINLSLLLSLFQLNKKYKTNFFIRSKFAILTEIARLISEEVFSLDEFLTSLDSPVVFFKLFVVAFQANNSLRSSSSLPIFRNNKWVCMDYDCEATVDAVVESTTACFQDCYAIHIGSKSAAQGCVSSLDQALRLLVTLWMEGNEILWRNYADTMVHQTNLAVPFPTYEFDLKSF